MWNEVESWYESVTPAQVVFWHVQLIREKFCSQENDFSSGKSNRIFSLFNDDVEDGHFVFFYNDIHAVQIPGATRGGKLQSKKHSL